MSGILDYLQDKKKKALGYMEQDPQMQVLSGVLGQYGEEGLDFLQQPGDVDEFMRRRGYKGEAEYPLGMEMTPGIDTLGDAAFTVNSAEDFKNDPTLWNAAKTVGGGILTAAPFLNVGMVKGAGKALGIGDDIIPPVKTAVPEGEVLLDADKGALASTLDEGILSLDSVGPNPPPWMSKSDEGVWFNQAEDIKRRREAGETITGKDFILPNEPDLRAEAIIGHYGEVKPGERKMLDVANMLQEYSDEALSGVDDVNSVGLQARRSAGETVDALIKAPEHKAWYGKSILETQSQAALKHKELLTDRDALSAFNYGFAVTSNGVAVPTNTKLALKAYEEYKLTGRMPENIGIGERSGQINAAMKQWNEGVDKWGRDDWVKFLNTDFSPAELRSLGYTVDATGAKKVKGSAILGPKIGGAFYQNLEGNFDPFTLDMWMRRNHGRGTKSVLETDPATLEKVKGRFEDALNTDGGITRMEEILGESLESVKGSPEMFNEVAARIFNRWGTTKGLNTKTGKMGGYAMTGVKEQDEAMRASRELSKSNQPVGGYTPAERSLQEESLYEAVDYMRAAGYDILPADMQALMWGHEQDLWRSLGSTTKPTPNFSGEMANVLGEQGYGTRKLSNARNKSVEYGEGESVLGNPASSFTPGEQRNWATDIVSADVREAIASSVGVDGGGVLTRRSGVTSRFDLSDGTQAVIQPRQIEGNYTLPKNLINKFKAHGLSSPAVQELKNTDETLKAFQDMSIQAQKSRGDLGYSLTVHSDPQQYKNNRNFLTEDGSAGFSLEGDNIVGVFNKVGGPHKGVTASMINMAVDAGGRRLDVFDILSKNGTSGLPKLYSRAGFKPVTKLKFDPSFPPEGMSVDEWKAWGDKHGNPDLVFMKYDPNADGAFDTKGLRYSNSYEAAVKKQKTKPKKIAPGVLGGPDKGVLGATNENGVIFE